MKNQKVYLVSDHTGLTVDAMAHSLLSQFADMDFDVNTARYIDNSEQMTKLLQSLSHYHSPQQPILILSTLVDPALRRLIEESGLPYVDLFEQMLPAVAEILHLPTEQRHGHHHRVHDSDHYYSRIQAINYTLAHDDGSHGDDYQDADLVLLGVSRSGKTPISLYLSMQFGLKVANYPFDEDELASDEMPHSLHGLDKARMFGLLIQPQRLHELRRARLPDTDYASLQRCQWETKRMGIWYQDYIVPFLDITELSVEEAATRILHYREQGGLR